jgi:hypothetical protein
MFLVISFYVMFVNFPVPKTRILVQENHNFLLLICYLQALVKFRVYNSYYVEIILRIVNNGHCDLMNKY